MFDNTTSPMGLNLTDEQLSVGLPIQNNPMEFHGSPRYFHVSSMEFYSVLMDAPWSFVEFHGDLMEPCQNVPAASNFAVYRQSFATCFLLESLRNLLADRKTCLLFLLCCLLLQIILNCFVEFHWSSMEYLW